jgi:peptidoglycan hydrolase-like protein with peptidoglycan-binding domain
MRRWRLVVAAALVLASAGTGWTHDDDADGAASDGVRFAQRELLTHGYYDGPLDGIAGAATRRALERFQHDQRLPVTAVADPATLRRLGADLESAGGSGVSNRGWGPGTPSPGSGAPDRSAGVN